MKKFCFVCGNETDKLLEGYCEDCYNKKFSLVKLPKEICVTFCGKCKKIKQGTLWEDISIEDFVKRNIKILGTLSKIEVKGNKLILTGKLENVSKPKEEVCEINIKKTKTICLRCSQKLGGYYETVIQLRGNITNSILDFVDSRINENSFYNAKAVKGGYDLFVGSKSVANDIAELLKKNYNFKISKSYKLFTRKEGKDVYRTMITVFCD